MIPKHDGLPDQLDRNHLCRMYEGVEYKEFWNNSKKNNLDLLEHAIVSSLIPASGRRILDIGCGFGRLADCYLNRFEQVVMLDGSVTLLQQAQEYAGERATYVAADANHLPFHIASFDCLLLIRVFHHLQDSQNILSEISRVLGDKGIFIFNYCNKFSLRQIFFWLLRLEQKNPLSLAPSGVGTRFITHHPKYVHQLLKQNSYYDVKYLGAGILDKIPDRSGRLVPLAMILAPFFGSTKLAPWINCRATASSTEPQDIRGKAENIFICPACHGDLTFQPNTYTCKSCATSYPINNGIIDFRLDANESP